MFEELLNNKNSWLSAKGPESDIVFSSRIRLARNLSGFIFPARVKDRQRKEVLDKILKAKKSSKLLNKTTFINMDELEPLDGQLLLERHLISREHLDLLNSRGLLVSKDENISIMINEEDHIRAQVMASGFDLGSCWNTINEIDDELSQKLKFSFLEDFGFLTSCPTNVGTAMRASCMLHLPALILTKKISKILELLARISFATRGLFGEGTQALGDFFQISNQVSLGVSEADIIDNLIGVVNQVKEQEISARESLMRKHKVSLEDSIWRALGILRNSRLINTKEAMGHLSILSLGLDLGIIKDNEFKGEFGPKELINRLFVFIQPAHLQKIESKSLKENQRDYIRAEILRKELGG